MKSETYVAEGNEAGGSASLTNTPHLAMKSETYVAAEEGKVAGGSASSPSSSETSVQKDVKSKIVFSEDKIKAMRLHMDQYFEERGITLKPAYGIPPGITFCNNANTLAQIRKEDRKYHEQRFRKQYDYGLNTDRSTNRFTGTIEDRTCISSHGILQWMEQSSGIMWVGIHGLDSVCVVTQSGHLDWKRVHGGLASTDPWTVLSLFRKCVFSEIEDLADPSSERSKKFKQSIKKPFCVVSATLGTTEFNKESGRENYKKAIEFLKDEITCETSFTVNGTIQMAISAFQHLFKERFEAKDIEVSVTCDIHPSILDLEVSQIEEYVAFIDNPAPPYSKKIKTTLVPVAPSCPSCLRPHNNRQGTPLHLTIESETSVVEGNVAGSTSLTNTSSPTSSQISIQKDVKCEIVFTEDEKKEMALHMTKYMKEHGITLNPSSGNPPGIAFCNNMNSLAKVRKGVRIYHEQRFRNQYDYGMTADGSTNPFIGTVEDRTCIWSDGIVPWREKASGIVWVGVHGLDSVCVVTRSGHLDWSRVHGGLASTDPRTVLSSFRKSVVSEIEDLADPSSERCKKIKQSKKPFCVVSVPRDTIETHKEICHENYNKAVGFVKDEITSETSVTVNGSIQMAISAFQHLFNKRFEAKEIEVSVACVIHPSILDLEVSQIEEYVAVIDDPALPHSNKLKTSLLPVAPLCPCCLSLHNKHH